jgi:hypothetical protein
MNYKKNWPYMVAAICFTLALLMFISSMTMPVDAAASVRWVIP